MNRAAATAPSWSNVCALYVAEGKDVRLCKVDSTRSMTYSTSCPFITTNTISHATPARCRLAVGQRRQQSKMPLAAAAAAASAHPSTCHIMQRHCHSSSISSTSISSIKRMASARPRTVAFDPHARRQQQHLTCRALLSERELEIKLAIAQSTDKLDLSDCQLEQLPAAVCELTGLRELSLAGNQLTQLPAALASLAGLERLVLAGNRLQQLPPALFELSGLEGLWVHGNQLSEVPAALGRLTKLHTLSLAGNRLAEVPDSLTCLVRLQDLNLSGNELQALPGGIGALTAVRKLSVHGNQLQQLPGDGWQHLQQLDELCVQGNRLTELPDSLAELGALTELSIADNAIRALPTNLTGWSSLRKAHLYGNRLQELPLGPDGLPALLLPGARGGSNGSASLASLWLEDNPLSPASVAQLLQLYADAYGAPDSSSSSSSAAKPLPRPRIGLDDRQLPPGSGVLRQWQQLQQRGLSNVRRGIIKGDGPGYFKLQLGPTSPLNNPIADAISSSSSNCGSSSSEGNGDRDGGGGCGDRVLIVAFGSAPGLPNWGGVLAKVAAAAESSEQLCFDVLYVVDPFRSWYSGGDAALMAQRYTTRLQQYTQQYRHVVMIGDSMGATACLLFAPLATAALAFCPQVDLTTSSIRPGHPPAWQAALQQHLTDAVRAAAPSGRITIYTGTWQHDVDQANLLSSAGNVTIKVHSVDSHRLALALAGQGRLAPLLREAILQERGIATGNVRLANLL